MYKTSVMNESQATVEKSMSVSGSKLTRRAADRAKQVELENRFVVGGLAYSRSGKKLGYSHVNKSK